VVGVLAWADSREAETVRRAVADVSARITSTWFGLRAFAAI
jgi:hypothetical protein